MALQSSFDEGDPRSLEDLLAEAEDDELFAKLNQEDTTPLEDQVADAELDELIGKATTEDTTPLEDQVADVESEELLDKFNTEDTTPLEDQVADAESEELFDKFNAREDTTPLEDQVAEAEDDSIDALLAQADAKDDSTSLEDRVAAEEKPSASADLITLNNLEILEAGSHEKAMGQLKELVDSHEWDDKQSAFDQAAKLAGHINRYYGVKPTPQLDHTAAAALSARLINPDLDESAKLNDIIDWQEEQKKQLRAKGAESVPYAKATEELIDAQATHLRRGVVAKDVGWFRDSLARGAESALSPIAETVDWAVGTPLKKGVKAVFESSINPERDATLLAGVASGAGSVAGFAGAALVPGGAPAYLGASIISESKQLYDATLQATGSHDEAAEAAFKGIPGNLLGTFADKVVAGGLKPFTLKNGYLKSLAGYGGSAGIEAGGEAIQEFSNQSVLASVTGDESLGPTAAGVGRAALIGGIVGAGAHGIHQGVGKFKETLDARAASEEPPPVKTESDVTPPLAATGEPINAQVTEPKADIPEPVTIPIPTKPPPKAGEPVADLTGAQLAVDPVRVAAIGAFPPSQFGTPIGPVQEFAEELGVVVKAVPLPTNIAGAYQDLDPKTGKPRIVLAHDRFVDPEEVARTATHEVGHAMDAAGKRAELQMHVVGPPQPGESVLDKFVRLDNLVKQVFAVPEVHDQASEMSVAVRPGWDGSAAPAGWEATPPESYEQYLAYRNTPSEIYADAVSGIFRNAEHTEKNYPKVWEAFTKGLDTQPDLKAMWEDYRKLQTDPQALADWTSTNLAVGRLKHYKIVDAAKRQEIADRPSVSDRISKLAGGIGNELFNRFGFVKAQIEAMPAGPAKDAAFEKYVGMTRQQGIYQKLNALFENPLTNFIKNGLPGYRLKGHEAKVDKATGETIPADLLGDVKELAIYDRIVDETTANLNDIREKNPLYRAAYESLYDTADIEYPGVNPFEHIGRDTNAFASKDGRAFSDRMALIHKALPEGVRVNLNRAMIKSGNIEAARLLSPDTFRVRRHLANPKMDWQTAERNREAMKVRLGKAFDQVETVKRRLLEMPFNPTMESLRRSQILPTELLNKMDLNAGTTAVFNVLNHFEDDPEFDGIVREQRGTTSEIGDPIISTFEKLKAIYSLSEYQDSQNSTVAYARDAGYKVEPVKAEVFRTIGGRPTKESVFSQKKELQKENPENSYLIEAVDGEFTLYEINSPEFAKMFEPSKFAEDTPAAATILNMVSAFSKMTLIRPLLTVYSPLLDIRQRMADRKTEASRARSAYPVIGIWHLDPMLRKMHREAKASAQNFQNFIYDSDTEFLTETNAIAEQYTIENGGIGDHLRVSDLIQSIAGVRPPGIESQPLADRWGKAGADIMENIGVGKWALGPKFSPFRWTRERMERHEVETKVMGYQIGKQLGMGDAQASIFAREKFGTPDPLGGGRQIGEVAKPLLFARAHFNGMRGSYENLKYDTKNTVLQYMYRKGLPRFLQSSILAGPLIGALFGDEAEKLYRTWFDKQPLFELQTKFLVPVGFIGGDGDFKFVWTSSADEIGPEHRAVGFRLPYERSQIEQGTLMEPVFKFVEDLVGDGTIDARKIGGDIAASLGTINPFSNFAPGVNVPFQLFALYTNQNPQDYFRGRGILSKDTMLAGSTLQRTYEYLAWSLNSHMPGIFDRSTLSSKLDHPTMMDHLKRVPLVGSTMGGLFGATNYGDKEKDEDAQKEVEELKARIRDGSGDNSKQLYYEYQKAQGFITRHGTTWAEDLKNPERVSRFRKLIYWHSQIYKDHSGEAIASYQSGDADQLKDVYDAWEESSSAYLEGLEP